MLFSTENREKAESVWVHAGDVMTHLLVPNAPPAMLIGCERCASGRVTSSSKLSFRDMVKAPQGFRLFFRVSFFPLFHGQRPLAWRRFFQVTSREPRATQRTADQLDGVLSQVCRAPAPPLSCRSSWRRWRHQSTPLAGRLQGEEPDAARLAPDMQVNRAPAGQPTSPPKGK